MKFPILTEQAVKEKILHAQILRSKSSNTTCLDSDIDICQSNIFQTDTNCLFFLPTEISLNLPFNGLIEGKVYFSCKEDNSLQSTVWSDFFESNNKPIFLNCCTQLYSLWQVNKSSEFYQKNLLYEKIFIFQDPNIKLVQVEEFQYLLKNAKWMINYHCAQPYTQAETPPDASMQMPSFYTERLLDSSQLTLEEINHISEETWEQLNVIHLRCVYRISSR